MKKLFLIFVAAFMACFAQAQMPIFRNSYTTNVPGAWVRGNHTFGNALSWVTVPGIFTNNGMAYFLGGTTYFSDGVEVDLPSTFYQTINIGGPVKATNTVTASNFVQSAVSWDDLFIPMSALSSPASTPGWVTFVGGVSAYGFDKASTEQLDTVLQIPHGISTNNAHGVRIHLHWTGLTAPGANSNVVWGIEYSWANPGGTFISPSITNRVTNGLATILQHQYVEFARVTNIIESAVFVGRIFRDGANAADTYDGDALGLSFDAHFPRIKMGSNFEYGDYVGP